MRLITVLIGGLFMFGLMVVGSNGLGGITGGWTNINVTDQGVQNASLFAVEELAQQNNSPFLYQLGSVLQASSQIVSGTNYNITLLVQLTNCSVNTFAGDSLCTATSQATCVVIVWYQAWMTPPMKLTNFTCTSWTAVQGSSSPSPLGNSSSFSTTPKSIGMGGLSGGWSNVDVSDQVVQNASLFAVAQLAQQNNSPFLYQLGSVLQARSQVVASTNYNITLNVQQTNCPTNSTANPVTCTATSQETCVVIVWFQSWMTPPMKLTNYSCTSWTAVQASSTPSPSGNSSSQSTSSAGHGMGGITGGWNNIDVNDEGVRNASLFAVSALAQQSNDMFLYQLGSVLQASSQVVAGINYNLTVNVLKTNCLRSAQNISSCTATSQETCIMIVWFQAWRTPSMMLTSFSCTSWTAVQPISTPVPQIDNSSVLQTEPAWVGMGGLPGGWNNINVTDEGVQNASLFAVSQLAQENNSTFLYQLGSVLQASVQVVAGANYNITLLVQLTDCPANSTANFISCTATSQEICVVGVWFQPWRTPVMKLTSSSCSSWTAVQVNSPTTRPANITMGGLTGGWSNINVTEQTVQNAAVFAVSQLAQQDNSPFLYQLGSVQQASSQVVAGINYNITLLVQLTNCPINSTANVVPCTTTSQKTCGVIVFVQPWSRPPMTLTSASCSSWTSLQTNSTANSSQNGTVGTTPVSSTVGGMASQVTSSAGPLLSNSSTPLKSSTPSDNIPGGWINVNVTDQRVQNVSLFAVGELARQSNSDLLYRLGAIQQASSQIVSGVKWNIALIVQRTNCSATTNNSRSCVAKYQSTCVVTVWVQAWMTPSMNLTSSSCTSWTAVQNLNASSDGVTRLRVSESYFYIICFAILTKILLHNYERVE